MKNILKEYYMLAKPGIIGGNVMTTIAAFLFVMRWQFEIPGAVPTFLATIVGLSLIIGSGCVFNNYLDKDIDKKMARTNHRALATGTIAPRNALVYGTILGIIGFALLYIYVNTITAWIAFLGFIFYVIIYGIAKRKTHWGAVVGSISGAVSIIVGYTAVSDRLDVVALILFFILVFWQMPHFYAIAMYRRDEYEAAGIPVLPVKKGIRATKMHIVSYILAYLGATIALWTIGGSGGGLTGAGGDIYLVSALAFGLAWLWRGLKGFKIKNDADDALWARGLFLFSLIVILSFSVTIAVAPLL